MGPRARPARAVCFVVGGDRGRRSRIWSVRPARTGAASGRGVVLGVRGDGPGAGPPDRDTSRTVRREGWAVTVPHAFSVDVDPDTAAVLGSSLYAPGPGWQVGALVAMPQAALSTSDAIALPLGCRRVAPPPRGHHVQVVLLLGELGAVELNLAADQDVGCFEVGGGRVQLWSHIVPTGPGAFGPRPAAGTAERSDRIPLVVDPG